MITAILAGAAVALLFDRLNIPGALIIGSMLGASAVTVLRDEGAIALPRPVVMAAYIVLGAAIGTTVTRELLAQFQQVALGALLSAVVMVLVGVALALGLQRVGLAPDGVVLATSPGALSVMAAAGAEIGVGAPVAVFHTVRVVLVILSLPLLIRLAERLG